MAGTWTTSLLLVLAIVPVASGQSLALARDCVPGQIDANTNAGSIWFEERPSTFRRATEAARTAGAPRGYIALVDSIEARFLRRSQGLRATERQSVLERLSSMREEIAGARRPASYFNITRNTDESAYVILAGTSDAIEIGEARPQAQRRALCWAMIEADDLSSDFSRPDRQAFATFLDERVKRWDNFHENGYSMLPFELLLNSWLGEKWRPLRRPALEPPAEQVIFLHPSVALEVPIKDISWSVHGRDAMVLEPLGYIRYNGSRTSFWGVSTAASLTVGEGPGWGGVVHLGRLSHIGYLYRPSPSDGQREHVVTISADMLKAVLGRAAQHRAEVDTLRQRVAECRANLPACVPVGARR